jgi:hypothetical protein
MIEDPPRTVVGQAGDRGQRCASGGPRLCTRPLIEPRHEPSARQRGGRRHVLPGRFGGAPLPRIPSSIAAPRLRQGPCDASPRLRELLALLAHSPRLRRCQRLVLLLGRQPQAPPSGLGSGTGGPYRTWPTRVRGAFHHARATALSTPLLPPRDRPVALGAAPLLPAPVHRAGLQGVRARARGLPPRARAGGPSQGDALGITAGDEEV